MAVLTAKVKAQCAQYASGTPGSCLCDKGYYGTNAEDGGLCEECQSGQTTANPSSSVGGNTRIDVDASVCAYCAEFASGTAGSCLCDKGYYGTDAEVGGWCEQCPFGYTTADPSNSVGGNTHSSADINVCAICAQFASGSPGSCLCDKGYYGTDAEVGGECKQCPLGQTTADPSNSVGGNTRSDADATVCANCALFASGTPGSCLCNKGYFGTDAEVGGWCEECPFGYTTGNPSNSEGGNTHNSADSSVCSIRLAQCAEFASGTAGSCLCDKGYYGTNAEFGGQCNQCPYGKTTLDPSSAVGGNTHSSADETVCSISEAPDCAEFALGTPGSCLCDKGYYGTDAEVGGLCTKCPLGTTTKNPSNSKGGNTHSDADVTVCSILESKCAQFASLKAGSCLCDKGYYGTNAELDGYCYECPFGTTTEDPSNSEGGNTYFAADISVCSVKEQADCTQFASGKPGSCLCDKGYYGKSAEFGGECNKCPFGTNTEDPSSSVGGNTHSSADVTVCSVKDKVECADNATWIAVICLCNKGYYGTNAESDGLCKKCPYKTTTQDPSNSEGGNTHFTTDVSVCSIKVEVKCTENASGTAGNCLCDKGYYGINAEVGGLCNKCPLGTTTDNPSNSAGGNTHSTANITVCTNCVENYYMVREAGATKAYKNTPSAALCNFCPPGTGNSGVSTLGDPSQCDICLPGYQMTAEAVAANPGANILAAAATCVDCTDGSSNIDGAKVVGYPSQCNTCRPNFYMQAAAFGLNRAKCIACPVGSGNIAGPTTVSNESVCHICLKNFFMTAIATSLDAAQCSPCPVFSSSIRSSTINTISSCTCFDDNAVPLSSKITQCQCKNGFTGSVATILGQQTGCKQCPKGQFSSAGSNCNICTAGSTITNDQGGCTCNDSSNGTMSWNSLTNVCECQQGYYGNPSTATSVGQTGSCNTCPEGTTSLAGAQAASDCTQIQGFVVYSLIISFSTIFGALALLI